MSVSSIQYSIESIQRDLESLHRQLSDEAAREADKSAAIVRATEAMSRMSNVSSLQSKRREIISLEKNRVSIQKKRADLTKRVSDKTRDLHKKQQDLVKAQNSEQSAALANMRKREAQLRTDTESKLRTLMTEANAIQIEDDARQVTSKYDAFISHATEDKEELVRPLAVLLIQMGLKIWYDEFQLRVGDSLRRSIDRGLARSRFGIVVLSPNFFAKNWPQYELDGLVAKESLGGKVILPLWHKVSKDEVIGYSPTLADRVALNTSVYSVAELAKELSAVLRG